MLCMHAALPLHATYACWVLLPLQSTQLAWLLPLYTQQIKSTLLLLQVELAKHLLCPAAFQCSASYQSLPDDVDALK